LIDVLISADWNFVGDASAVSTPLPATADDVTSRRRPAGARCCDWSRLRPWAERGLSVGE